MATAEILIMQVYNLKAIWFYAMYVPGDVRWDEEPLEAHLQTASHSLQDPVTINVHPPKFQS